MSWNLVGSIIYSFTQWLLLIVIAKLGTPEMVGHYALGLAITAPIVLLTNMELRLALITDTKNTYLFGKYIGTRLLTVSLAFFIILLVIFVIGYDLYTAMIILFIGIAKLPESISDIFHGQLQKQERMDLTTISNVLKGVLTVITFSAILYFTSSLALAIIGQILIWTIILLCYDLQVVKGFVSIKINFEVKKIKKLVQLSFPLGLMALLTSFNTNIPNYFVEYFLGKKELGYLAAILYILFAGNRLADSLRQPAATRLANLYQQNNSKDFRKLLGLLVAIGFFIGIIGLILTFAFGKVLITFIYTPEYATYSTLFIIIMGAGTFSYPAMFLDTGLIATRHFKVQPYLAALWVIASLIGCLLFIPNYGLYGAAYAIILASLVKLLSLLFVLIIILKKRNALTNYSLTLKEGAS